MKLLVLCCLAAAAVAVPFPADNSAQAQVLKYEYDNFGPNGFRYAYDQSDGTKAEAHGELINGGQEDAALVIKGFFQYIGSNGLVYTVSYIADQDGYQPKIEEPVEEGPGGFLPDALFKSILGGGGQDVQRQPKKTNANNNNKYKNRSRP